MGKGKLMKFEMILIYIMHLACSKEGTIMTVPAAVIPVAWMSFYKVFNFIFEDFASMKNL